MSTVLRFLFLSGILLLVQSCKIQELPAEERFRHNRVLFLGNSITQNGTYVSCIEYLLRKHYPDLDPEIISIGLASETVSGLTENDHPFPRPQLAERLDRALELVQPDIVVACYGMNDGIYHPPDKAREAAFREGIKALIKKSKKTGAPLILMTPPPFDPLPIADQVIGQKASDFSYRQPYQDYDQVLGRYSEWLMDQSSLRVKVVDWHTEIRDFLATARKGNPDFSFAQDGIHPSPEGHLFMARVFLEGAGFTIPNDKTLSWESMTKDPLFQLINDQRRMRSAAWLAYVGYTRGERVRSVSPRPLLILMGGQSNMVGSGKRSELTAQELPPGIHFLNFGRNANLKQDTRSFGPEVGLSEELQKAFPHQPVILLKYAVGGSSLLDWAPEYSKEKAEITGNPRFGNMFETFFQKIDSIVGVYDPEITALLWMQGERDARIPEAGKDYYINFNHFIKAFRTRIGYSELPIIFGLVNPDEERYPALEMVQQAQREIAAELPQVYLIETDDLDKHKDNVHYNTQGQLELGRKFGQAVNEYLQNKTDL